MEPVADAELAFHKHSGTVETPMLLFRSASGIPGGAARSRAHCIIGVPPIFLICAKGDDQSLKAKLCSEPVAYAELSFTKTAAQARRLWYFFAWHQASPVARHVVEPIVS
jgi:hypothetical protein